MKRHLQFNWWKYLIVILAPVFLWCSVFSALAAPGPNERVNILYVGEDLDAAGLRQALEASLPGLTGQQLKSIAVDTTILDGSSYSSTLAARCVNYDILILQESYLRENVGQSVFVRMTEELLEQFPDTTAYTEVVEDGGTLAFGLVLYDGTAKNTFSTYYTGSEHCCLFISPYSVNFDTLNESGSAGDNAALKAVQYLLEMTP